MILQTERLILRDLVIEDAFFILELLNEPGFVRYIGDRGIRTLDQARSYLHQGPLMSYAQYGFGLYLVLLKEEKTPIGMCGLLRREGLPEPDIGFALLERFWSNGYATESARAMMQYGKEVLGLPRIVGLTAPDNHGSIHVLEKLGLKFDRLIELPEFPVPRKLFVPCT